MILLTHGLLARLQKTFPAAGRMENPENADFLAIADQASVRLTDGRTAAQVAFEENQPDTVIIDLAYEYETAPVIAMAPGPRCTQAACQAAIGLFQAAGYQVVIFNDVPGLAVMRTVAMLINEAADAAK